MSIHTETYYRNIAADALSRAAITEPPVALDSLAESIGIPVREVQLPMFFSGALITEDGMPVAIVNAAHKEESYRRTLAHLLAHVLIVLTDSVEQYPRGRIREHHEADVTAGELLLPATLIREQARKWFNDYRYLARLFGVNEREMVRRMGELGIMKARGTYWER